MRSLIVLIFGALLSAAGADLSAIHKVYVMPMSGGLDQYLAQRITHESLFTVVVDPKQADAVLSERVDPAFEAKLQELYPAPKPAQPKKDAPVEQPKEPSRAATSHSRGNVFLVAVASRQVVWSTYQKMPDRSPHGLHRAAGDIVKSLKKDLEAK